MLRCDWLIGFEDADEIAAEDLFDICGFIAPSEEFTGHQRVGSDVIQLLGRGFDAIEV